MSVFEKRPKLMGLSVALFVVLLLDIFSATIFFLIKDYPYSRHKEVMYMQYYIDSYFIEKKYRKKSNIYHHGLMEKAHVENVSWGGNRYTVTTNSLGFKSDGVTDIPLVSEGHRILFIGDSMTEGVGYGYQDTFVGLIASSLSEKSIQVLNAGVSSYSPAVYWSKVKYLIESVGLDFEELIVYIDISDIQDDALSYMVSKEGIVDLQPDVARSEEASRLDKLASIKQTREKIENLISNDDLTVKDFSILLNLDVNNAFFEDDKYVKKINLDRARWTIDEDVMKIYGIKGLEKSDYYMSKLYELLQEHGIKLTISVYPWPDQIVANDLESLQVVYWKDWAETREVGFIDNFPCFISQDALDNDHEEMLRLYYISNDVHWNGRGHKLIADNFMAVYRDGEFNDGSYKMCGS